MPWLQLEARRNPSGMAEFLGDCGKCMKKMTAIDRRLMGCGYEPRSEHAAIWTHHGADLGDDEQPTVCSGFTTKLPGVVEISRARLHWSKGQLAEFCDGKPTQALMRGIEILDQEYAMAQAWEMENPVKGGQ